MVDPQADDLDPATRQLLHAAVCEATGATAVVHAEMVQRLWSGYGAIVRCRLRGGPVGSVVAKLVRWPDADAHPRGWNSAHGHARKVRSYAVEACWYRDYADRCPPACRVPHAYAVRSHGHERIVVLEDLDAAGFPRRLRTPGPEAIAACLRWLAAFHATFMGHPPDGLWPVGTYWHLETRPDELAAMPDGRLKDAAAALDARLTDTRFTTLVHGDAKLANFCFDAKAHTASAVDFQYVGGGCGIKDVAYLLSSCLDEDACARQEDRWLRTYFAALAAALAEGSRSIDAAAVEAQWRALYPTAWADFVRFLVGWSPGHAKLHRYSRRLTREAIEAL